jgi:hypothetical protein
MMANTMRERGFAKLGVVAAVALSVGACGSGAKTGSENPAPTGCTAPQGASGSPANVDELVTLVNTLGAARSFPVDIDCVLESLDRPLGFLASVSPFSLQQTTDFRSPRFFLWSGNLVMTAAPIGDGRNLIELGYETSETRSVKAEIIFPVTSPLPPAQPYEHLVQNGATACGSCHGLERPAPQPATTDAFESNIFRPLPSQEVNLPYLQGQFATCDSQAEPERCAMFAAIFGHGELVPRAFSDQAATIYDN